MYISAKYIDIKSKQDYAEYFEFENKRGIVICDGIGEFEQSGEVSKFVVEKYVEQYKNNDFNVTEFVKSIPPVLKEKSIIGGTTFITAELFSNKVIFNYLGNGGVINLKGDFYKNPVSSMPYRYIELMNPDITPAGALNKHISHNSGEQELELSSLTVSTNSITGDIFLMFTDGISTLEEHVIVEDDNKNLWRNEPIAIKVILEELHFFLKDNCNKDNFQDNLSKMNEAMLHKLGSENLLEDDASLGIIITEKVLEYYKSQNNDK
jgi:serine/threonine protein phosphatase PrpC